MSWSLNPDEFEVLMSKAGDELLPALREANPALISPDLQPVDGAA